ncbi:MAG: hypothetical protein EBS05_21190 [Proteobacteria bacterium]|nr:hypothetical protein [Pseudomonadota bacterium]
MFAGLLATAGAVHAGDLFSISANNGTTVGGNNVVDLIDNAVNRSGAFATATAGNLNYAGVANAIQYTTTGLTPGRPYEITIPSTGLNVNFASTQELKDYLKKNGSDEIAKFLKAMAAQSLVAITDGNPGSSTARAASDSYQNYAMTFAETKEEKDGNKPNADRVGFGIIADVGRFDANGIRGEVYSLPLFARFKLTDRVGLNLDIPLNYTKIEGANAFGVGLGIGLPVKVIPRTKESPWYWQLTPFGGANATASRDLAAGGLIADGGLNSLLAYDFGSFTLSMGNHFSLHEGVPITVSSYRFDPGVSQQILKNGLKLDVPLGKRWIVDVYAVHTKFLTAAAVDQYATIGGEIG